MVVLRQFLRYTLVRAKLTRGDHTGSRLRCYIVQTVEATRNSDGATIVLNLLEYWNNPAAYSPVITPPDDPRNIERWGLEVFDEVTSTLSYLQVDSTTGALRIFDEVANTYVVITPTTGPPGNFDAVIDGAAVSLPYVQF